MAVLGPALGGAGTHRRPARKGQHHPERPARRARPTARDHGTRGIAEEHVHVRRGDTLESLLAAHGVGVAEARPWIAAATAVYDLRRLAPRRGLTLRFDRATHALEAIRYEMDERSLLVLERTAGDIHAARAPLPYFTEVKGVAGRIERGLREDATGAGVPARVVSELADVFGWELDLASGTVVEAGWVHQLGRSVRVEHSGGLRSVYGHLRRIADGVREGMAVERGQVIGYVGSSGLSTGPHLHFALDRGGEYVDPLKLTAAPGPRLPEPARRLFDRVQKAVTRQLATLPRGGSPLTVSLSTPAYRTE